MGIQARRRMALSGTPLQSRPVELLPMLTLAEPDPLAEKRLA
jgi:hypothetical protein